MERWAFGVLALCVYTSYVTRHDDAYICVVKVQMYLVVTGDIQDQFLEFTG